MSEIVKKFPNSHGNENKIRVIAFLVLVLISVYIFTQWIAIPDLLLLDFGLRGFHFTKYSPLGWVAEGLVKLLGLGVKPIFLAPKRFAAKVGLVFSATIIALQLFGINTIAVSSILAICAALESLAGLCVGCYVFSFLQRFKIFGNA